MAPVASCCDRSVIESTYPVKPVERRSLWCGKSLNSQGSLELWVDILTPQQAARYSKWDIALPPPEEFEIRCVVWKTKNVIPGDTLTNMTDMFIRGWVEGHPPQETDVHLRCDGGWLGCSEL